MKEEQVDALLEMSEVAMRGMTGMGVDEALSKGQALTRWVAELFGKMESKDAVRGYLLRCDETDEYWRMTIALVQYMPMLIKMGLAGLAEQAKNDLPGPPTGRKKALSLVQERQLCEFIGELHTYGLTKTKSLVRAAQRFGVSKNTAARTWGKRKQIMSGETQPTFEEAAKALQLLLIRTKVEVLH